MTVPVVLAFDEGPGAGLGHRRRCQALAAALGSLGHACELRPLELPLSGPVDAPVVVVDSYRVRADDARCARAPVLVAVDDLRRDLAVDLLVDPSPGATAAPHRAAHHVCAGAPYALLDPGVPAIAARRLDEPVRRILVTTGASDTGGAGSRMAGAIADAFVGVEVALVVGPWGSPSVPDGVDAIRPAGAEGLASDLAAADIVVSAGGVTMLEAVLLGRPTIAVALADNQHQAVTALAAAGAVVQATPATATAAAVALTRAPRMRRALVDAGRRVLDGHGPERVAREIDALVRAEADVRS